MHNEPLISVIVYVNKDTNYLEKCLKTLTLQTYKNLEIICIESDAGIENLNIINTFKENDDRIKVYNQENDSISCAYNAGISLSSGEYISFINSKDWVLLDLYETFADTIKTKNVDVYMFNVSISTNETSDVLLFDFFGTEDFYNYESKDSVYTYKNIKNPILKNTQIINKIYRKDFLKNNQISFIENTNYNDALFNLKTLVKAESIAINNEVYYRYRGRYRIDGAHTEKIFDIFKINKMVEEFLKEEGIFEQYEKELFNYVFNSYMAYFNFCPDESKGRYLDTMKANTESLIYSMTPQNRNEVMKFPPVKHLLSPSEEELSK